MTRLENTIKWSFVLFVLILIGQKRIIIKLLEFHVFLKKVLFWTKKTWKNKKVRIFWLVFFINLGIKSAIDFWLTPILIKNDYLFSLFITTVIYILMGIMSVKLYDKYGKGKDPLWVEDLKKFQSEGGHLKYKNKLIIFILKNDKKNEFVLNILLTFKNSGLGVIYKRPGFNLYNGFTGKNTKIFFIFNILVMTLYWNSMVYLGIHIWSSLWNLLKELFFWYNLYHI